MSSRQDLSPMRSRFGHSDDLGQLWMFKCIARVNLIISPLRPCLKMIGVTNLSPLPSSNYCDSHWLL